MMPFHSVISNFEKKQCSIVNKRLSPEVFRVESFSRKGELCKKRINSIELSTFLKYGLTEVKKAPSQIFDLVLNMPLWA